MNNNFNVSNLLSPHGNYVPNQFEVYAYNKGAGVYGYYFKSYNSIVCFKSNIIILYDNYDYSMTTSKYLNVFVGMTSKEATKKINDISEKVILLNDNIINNLIEKVKTKFIILKQKNYYQYNFNDDYSSLKNNEIKILKYLIVKDKKYIIDEEKQGVVNYITNKLLNC